MHYCILYICIFLYLLVYGGNLLAQTNSQNLWQLPQKEEELKFLKNEPLKSMLLDRTKKRPKQCPLKSTQYENLTQDLKDITKILKKGACLDNNSSIISSLEEILESGDSLTAIMRNRNQLGAMPQNQMGRMPQGMTLVGQQNRNMAGRIFSNLAHVSKDQACVDNMREHGFLAGTANILTTIGQTALFIPSSNGFLLGAATLGFGTTLRAVSNLFKTKFNWEKTTERNQFRDLNCEFFDMRRDLEKTAIFKLPGTGIKDELKLTQQALEQISGKVKELLRRQKEFFQQVFTQKKDHFISRHNEKHYQTLKTIEKWQQEFPSLIKPPNEEEKIKIIKSLITREKSFDKDLEDVANNNPFYKSFLQQLKYFSWEKFEELLKLKTNDFFYQHYQSIYLSLLEINKTLQKQKQESDLDFEKQMLPQQQIKISEQIKKVEKVYELLLKSCERPLNLLRLQLDILKQREKKKDLDPSDESAHNLYEIVLEYNKIKDIIYEKIGYSYIKYHRRNLRRSRKYFEKGYKKFLKKYPFHKEVSPEKLIWACRDGQELRIKWESAYSTAQLAFDFIQTNSGIIHSNPRYFNLLLGFLPISTHPQRKLYLSTLGIETLTQSKIEDSTLLKLKLKDSGWRKNKNLGEQIRNWQATKHHRRKIESFMDEKICEQYF